MKTNSTTTESAGQTHTQGSFFAGKDQPAAPFFGASLIQRKLQEAQDSPSSGLDSETRPALEGFLNHDLSHVQVHNNSASHEASGHIQAKAYTTGSHIFMGSGTGSMSPIQRKALLAHEVVHTIQQKSIAPGTVQAKPEIGEANSSHEAEADNIAQAFVQSQATGYRSPGLQMRSNLAISPVSRPAIQRSVKTWGGEWDTSAYTDAIDKKMNGTAAPAAWKMRGVDITVKFTPNNNADSELIGLLQTAQSISGGKHPFIDGDANREKRALTEGAERGTMIDRADGYNNPIYAVQSQPSASLDDTNTYAGWGQHGWNSKTMKPTQQDATLIDTPRLSNADLDSSQTFETTAIALKGPQTGTYYGSIRWGWKTDAKGTFSKIDPIELVSQGVPTATFMKAGEVWNNAKDSTGADTIDLPLEQLYVVLSAVNMRTTTGAILPLPADTRVALKGWNISMGNFVEIMVADGPNTSQRGYIHNDNLRDEAQRAFAPLGPGIPEQRPKENDAGTFVG